MKKLFIILSLAFTNLVVSQNSSGIADLKDADIVSSTAASLLDNAAAVIISNPNYKDFNVNTENLSNISFDFSINKRKLNGLQYYGLGTDVKDFKQVTIDKLLRPSISLMVRKNDTVAYVAVGMSVNIVTIFRVNKIDLANSYKNMRNKTDELVEAADKIMARDYPNLNRFTNTDEFNTQRVKVLDSIPTDEADEFANILKRPLLTVDLASAYSVLYPDQTYDNSRPDRIGMWTTITYSPKLSGNSNFLNLYGFIRYLNDKSVYNLADLNYTDQFEYFDYGGKIQIDFDAIAVGYEYINRNGDGKDYRSVGIIQYKINTSLYLTGGFGKNFNSTADKNLISLLGIKWGINLEDKKNWSTK